LQFRLFIALKGNGLERSHSFGEFGQVNGKIDSTAFDLGWIWVACDYLEIEEELYGVDIAYWFVILGFVGAEEDRYVEAVLVGA
jgi:hypothetical protein